MGKKDKPKSDKAPARKLFGSSKPANSSTPAQSPRDASFSSKNGKGKKNGKASKQSAAEQERLDTVAQAVVDAQKEFERENPLTKQDMRARIEISQQAELFELGGGLTLRYAYMSQRGYYPESLNKNNQDAFKVVRNFNGVADHLLLGVFDGHGQDGDGVSYFVRDNIEDELREQMAKHPEDFEKAYTQCFITLNNDVKQQEFDAVNSGTTAITVFFHGPEMTVANIGDSRAIVGEQKAERVMAYSLSIDQTPYRKDERERCKAAGAAVMSLDQMEGFAPMHENWGLNLGEETDDGGDPPRLWVKGQGYPGCAFTRSIGDDMAESVGVFAEPELLVKTLGPKDVFVCLASDGVWEFLTNQTVTDIIMNFDDPVHACRAIISESYRLWLQYETRTDDITMILGFIDIAEIPEGTNASRPSTKVRKGSASGISSGLSIVIAGGENRPVRRGLSREKKQQMAIAMSAQDDEDDPAGAVPVEVVPKTEAERAQIRDAVRTNFLFSHLIDEQANQLFDVMRRLPVESGDVVIRQGDVGDQFYVVDSGEFAVTVDMGGKSVEVMKYATHACFGELALMYSKPRAATVTALSSGFLWAVDRRSFRTILMKSSATSTIKTLRAVDILKSLSVGQLQRLEDLLTEMTFKQGDYIIKQGDRAENLYVISSGNVNITKSSGSAFGGVESALMELGPGSYFGERALLTAEPRAANVIALSPQVKLLHISKYAFEEVLGPLQEIIDADRQRRELVAKDMKLQQEAEGLVGVTISDFEVLATSYTNEPLRFMIARRTGNSTSTYTLKASSKATAQEMGVAQRILAERELMEAMTCSHRMVPVPMAFMEDNVYHYSVFKTRTAISLATLLADGTAFNEETTKFYTASVALAIEHLQRDEHRVIYRNITPDGLVLDADGYIQLMEMRYACKVDPPPRDFCGYAHYLAPEQVTAQGHGLPTDLWALGILTYEMICGGGNPWLTGLPEQDSEVGVFSRISAHQVGALKFPEGVSVGAPLSELLNMLTDPSPATRLGCVNGPRDVRDAEWFEGFPFAELERGETAAPHAAVAADTLAQVLYAATKSD